MERFVIIPAVIFFILSFLNTWGFGQAPIEKGIKKIVTFLFTYDGENVRAGTGFFIALDGEKPPVYLVTAKHVVMDDSGNYYPKLCMKINDRQWGAETIPIDLSRPHAARVFVNSNDPDVDIAVILATDIKLIPGPPYVST